MSAMNARAKFDHVAEDRIGRPTSSGSPSAWPPRSRRRGSSRGSSGGSASTWRWCRSRSRRRSSRRSRWASSRPGGRGSGKPLRRAATGVIQDDPSLGCCSCSADPPAGDRLRSRALVALFLYSSPSPIVRNTATPACGTSCQSLRESAEGALGLLPWAWLRLRGAAAGLGAPSSRAGIKTAAVINVGTATIGALIGAGGFGQPILTGIRRDDIPMILFEGRYPRRRPRPGRPGGLRPGRAVAGAQGVADLVRLPS